MKTKVIETHWVADPVISTQDREIERDFIPMVSRQLFFRIWPFWFGSRKQVIRKNLNEYISVATMGGTLDYSSYWHPELLKVDITIRK